MKSARILPLCFFVFGIPGFIFSQGCCSGGGGSPIAGGASQGVLLDRQMEVMVNHQYLQSDKFYSGDKDTAKLFDKLYSNYLYFRVAYGITKDLTMSVETGYFINKSLISLEHRDTISSSGIADLILFPRYDIINRTTETHRTEWTVGLGYKIPLGKHNDSTVSYIDPTTAQKYYTTSPPTVQPTNGSNDYIFYTFLSRNYTQKNFRVFGNALYIRKGWNSLGEKFGDYASMSVFVSKTYLKHWGVTLQLKGEHIAKMQAAKNVDLVASYNVYTQSTGGKTVYLVPQLSYSKKALTIFALANLPVYQYLNGVQIGTQYFITSGLSYRFYMKKPIGE
ncbi:MAG: hypothetical protein PSX36_13880 [bacterium]|nr:hypothetical protein [bacterium]